MSHYAEADYLMVNDDFQLALSQLEKIILGQIDQNSVMVDEDLINNLLA